MILSYAGKICSFEKPSLAVSKTVLHIYTLKSCCHELGLHSKASSMNAQNGWNQFKSVSRAAGM
jgi:hypothetical protein